MIRFCVPRCHNFLLVPAVRREIRTIHSLENIQYRFRTMKEQDFPQVNQILDEDNWVMEKAYLQCAFATDPSGFVVAETTDEQIIGFIGALSLAENLVAMGTWLVKKEYRSSGVGLQLFKIMQTRFEQNTAGFIWPHNQEQVAGLLEPLTQVYTSWYNYGKVDQHTCLKNMQMIEHKESAVILALEQSAISDVIQYDTQIHKIPRKSYIRNWISHEESKTYVAVKDDTVCGFAVLRSQDDFNQIAPLYADNWYVANKLFLRLASEVPKGCIVGFASPLENNDATRLAVRHRLMKRGMPMLMVFKHEPIFIDFKKVYSLSSTSFGLC